MKFIKIILSLLLGLIFGCGFWYLIFWFVSNQPNMFEWHWITKIVYLLLSLSTLNGIFDMIKSEWDD
jgi:multisubunit Na+/H+ antiporter MnhE subunit